MSKKRTNLQDVAERVGVTKMTISRYLQNPERVSAPLRFKIASALDELGYIPNRVPQILSSSKSKAIGVLLPSLTNQVFAEVLRGIENVTDKQGYQAMFAHYGYNPEVEEKRLNSLLSFNIDGLILSDRNHTKRTLSMINAAGIPVVEIMDSVSPCIDLSVGFDNYDAAYQMTKVILGRGYAYPVYLGARLDERTLIKLKGYEQAMRESNLEPRSVNTDISSTYTLGGVLLREALLRYPETDSIFCTNDDIAVGAVFECQRMGLSVPQDMAIAGFHGHNIGQSMVPKLTSVLTPREEIGKIAALQILARLNGESIQNQMLDLGFSILHGESL